jgi:catechol 2,3-dioxygenase-like lactoylglutathione lyase family enzyme
MNLKLNHIQHIGIPVTNIKVSEAFYERLGFKNVMDSTFEHKGGKGIVSMMKLNEIIIELYQMPETELEEIRNRRNGHIDHIAFDVSDINKAFEEIKANGFIVLEEQPVFLSFWQKGCKYFNITGPDGERLEFNQILITSPLEGQGGYYE